MNTFRKTLAFNNYAFLLGVMSFPSGSAGKESACNVETSARSLSWEKPLEEGMATHSSNLAWRIPWTTVHGTPKSQTQLSNFQFYFH